VTRSVLFDASRLLSRAERTAPTGVDRVCLAYAEWLLSLPDVQVTPVRGRQDQLVTVDEAWFRKCVRTLRSRWTGDFFERSLTPDEMRLMTALSSDATRTSQNTERRMSKGTNRGSGAKASVRW
jgi:hypothetical protein